MGPICFTMPNFMKIDQTVAEIWRFNGLENGGRPPCWILAIQIFQLSRRLRDPFCVIVPNFAKIGHSLAVISRFLWFLDGCRRHLGFWKIGNFNDLPLYGSNLRQNAKFHENRSNGCWDMAIWRFFQNGGRPPSWICRVRIGTTHEDYSVVCIVELNLVGIAAVLSIILKF